MTYSKPRLPLRLLPLDAHGALLVVDALWPVHGDHMADILAREGVDTPTPDGSVRSGPQNPANNTDLDS